MCSVQHFKVKQLQLESNDADSLTFQSAPFAFRIFTLLLSVVVVIVIITFFVMIFFYCWHNRSLCIPYTIHSLHIVDLREKKNAKQVPMAAQTRNTCLCTTKDKDTHNNKYTN